MDRMERIAIEHECARLVYGFCNHVDAQEYDDFVALWAPDGVWETWKGPITGPAAIRAYLDARPRAEVSRHHCTNVVIDVIDGTHARGRAYFSFYVARPGTDDGKGPGILTGPAVVGEYRDEFRLTPAGWRIARRGTLITLALEAPASGPMPRHATAPRRG